MSWYALMAVDSFSKIMRHATKQKWFRNGLRGRTTSLRCWSYEVITNKVQEPDHATPLADLPPRSSRSNNLRLINSTTSSTPSICPPSATRPSPNSTSLRQQIISGTYTDLAQLFQPSKCPSATPMELSHPPRLPICRPPSPIQPGHIMGSPGLRALLSIICGTFNLNR